ncbi:MAG TPA: hypothetical protein VGK44_07200 [Casimicrobiaceae bacterium]|jgi:hypothetical protein
MKRYEASTPRTAFAFLAVALTAVTLGLSVVVPAHVHADATPGESIIADAPTRVERIDVIAVRTSNVAAMQSHGVRRKLQQG